MVGTRLVSEVMVALAGSHQHTSWKTSSKEPTMNKQPFNQPNPAAPRATNIDEVRGDFWYGPSRYPLHDSQLAELRTAIEAQLAVMQVTVENLMSKWSGGFTLRSEMVTLDFIGDGWNVGFGKGNPQRFVDVALMEAASDTEVQ